MTTIDTEPELEAIRLDAQQRLVELRRVAAALWGDRDDPAVLSELTAILGAIRQAEAALRFAAGTSPAPDAGPPTGAG